MTEIGDDLEKNVWTKIPGREALISGWKTRITVWIDINKGDIETSLKRSSLVRKEFNNGDARGLFAGTPLVESLRLLLSDVAT